MTRAIHGVFFLSGVGALVFENVWFSQTGLILGNSVWSAALVIGAFMAGLALGNAAAVVLARRWGNLVYGYAVLEIVAALSGAMLVLAFPYLPAVFHPLLAPFLDEAVLNLIRPAIAFVLMVIPAAALGTTLPLLCKPLETATGNYGVALGRLYGVNTLGAVAGALLSELVLIPWLGLRGSGMFAAACNLSAAVIALRLARNPMFQGLRSTRERLVLTIDGRRIVAAAFLAGGILLALEVIWFRYLLLFFTGTTLIFAVMLAVVLAGIGLGAMIASWGSRRWSSGAVARLAAAGGAVGVVAGYGGFAVVGETLARFQSVQSEPVLPAVLMSIFLMGPVSVLSGVLFTALGQQLRARMADAVSTTALLALANTLGAMLGSLLAVFVVLPARGLEGSFFLLASLYVVTVLIIPAREAARRWRMAPALAAAAALVLFPFGRMADTHHRRVEAHFGARLVAAREGIAETAFYLAHGFLGELLYHRLVTNSHSMSDSGLLSQRYMKLFAYLPAAFHPGIEQALVICFGVGSTASALTDLPEVRAIDVVDVSRDILEMSDIAHAHAGRHPLRDRRVSVHVEDGRFFLQQTARRYDLITGEPPPPKMAGVASLYSREYFELLRNRLNPAGLATYWLPVHQLREADALAIIRAFCEAFEDCSLWSGVGLDWMLMGSRGGIAPVSRERFARLWTLPKPGRELARIGFDRPEQLVAQFMADAALLRELTALALPLRDDFPRRISSELPTGRAEPLFASLMDGERNRARLESSPWIASILPASLLSESGERFRQRAMLDASWYPESRRAGHSLWSDLAELIRHTDLVTAPQWMLGSESRMAEIAGQRAASGHAGNPVVAEHLAIDALVNRRKPQQGMAQDRFLAMTPKGQVVTIFHHCLAGDPAEARSLMAWIPERGRSQEPYSSFFAWAGSRCAISQ